MGGDDGAGDHRSYLQASSRNLATDLARYGSTAQWRGVYYRGEKIGFTVSQVQVLLLPEILVVAGNELLGVDPFLKRMSAAAIVFMAFALVGLASGLGARYPRFAADNPSQVAGAYGGVAFMVLAVLFIIVMIVLLGWPSSIYLFAQFRNRAPPARDRDGSGARCDQECSRICGHETPAHLLRHRCHRLCTGRRPRTKGR